jgi:hypothetical protein
VVTIRLGPSPAASLEEKANTIKGILIAFNLLFIECNHRGQCRANELTSTVNNLACSTSAGLALSRKVSTAENDLACIMARSRMIRLADRWKPATGDPHGEDKRRLIRYLLDTNRTATNPVTLAKVLRDIPFETVSHREGLQHKLLGPLRRDSKVFVGTSSAGIFLVTSPEDADATLGFYTWRIRAEMRHARNLRNLAKRTKLFEGHQSAIPDNKERAVIYVDESGNPDIKNHEPPVFVVAAVLVESRKDVAGLDQRFRNAFAAINRPEEHEMRSSGLSEIKHSRVLRELSLLDYQWAAACFDKKRLQSPGFTDPTSFYRYAFQFLIGDLLTVAWQSDLVIDEHSTSEFQSALERYLRKQNSGLPVNRLGAVRFAQSSKERLVQLADLVAGAVRRAVNGEELPLREIEPKMINLQLWPPH